MSKNKSDNNPHVIVIPQNSVKTYDNDLIFINKLLTKTKQLCGNVNLFGGGIANASLYGIYVPMPTNFKLNISVRNHSIEFIEEERIYKDDTLKFSEGKSDNIKRLEGTAFNLIKEKLTQHIEQGDEYNYPNPKDRPLIISAPWADGYKKNYWTLNVFDIVAIYDRIALLGRPGTGKSTSLKYLAATLCENFLNKKIDTDVSTLSDSLFSEQYIPIYIEFRKLAEWWKQGVDDLELNTIDRINLKLITRYIFNQLGCEYNDEKTLPCGYKYVFMFDGIDEIPQGITNIDYVFSQNALNCLVSEITGEHSAYKDSKIIFSSRIDEFNSYPLNNFEVVEIVSMNEYIAVDLIDNIKTLCNYNEVNFSKSLLSELKLKGFGDDVLLNPMLLSLLSFVAINSGNGKLPDNKCDVLRDSIELLLKRWSTKGENKPTFFNQFENDGNLYGQEIFNNLERFAYESEENGQISDAVLYRFMRTEKSNANSIMDYLSKTAGLIVEDTNSSVKFAHKSFRSYLAASFICHQENVVELLIKEIDKSIKMGGINETLALAVDILADDTAQCYKLESFLSRVIENYENEDICIWFVAKLVCSREKKFYTKISNNNPYVIKKLINRLQYVFKFSLNISINKRVECGYFLGELGDNRDGVNADCSLPNIVWCPINEQVLEFGITKTAREMISRTPWGGDIDFSRECTKSGETININIKEFEISKYPITVAQFTVFLQDNLGYKNKDWYSWSKASLDFYNREIETVQVEDDRYYYGFILPKSFQIPNLPMTHVPFFVAIAFCKWLSKKNNDGTIIRLPTEMEWETVAKMRGGQVFEWGDAGVNLEWEYDYVINNCNCLGTKLQRICPVGSFNDSTETRPIDLIGNVWEWTSSYFTDVLGVVNENTTINTDTNSNLTTEISRNLLITNRGGSLHNGVNGLRVSFRGRDPILADVADRHSFRVIRTKHSNINYYDEKKLVKHRSKNEIAEGYGLPIKEGETITILYSIYKKGEILQPQSDFTFVLGKGVIHHVLEKEIMNNHRIACNIRKHISGRELFDSKGYKNIIGPDDDLEIFIHIKDTMEI